MLRTANLERGWSMERYVTSFFRPTKFWRFSTTPHGAIPMLTTRPPRRRGDRSDIRASPTCRVTPVLVPPVITHAPTIKDRNCHQFYSINRKFTNSVDQSTEYSPSDTSYDLTGDSCHANLLIIHEASFSMAAKFFEILVTQVVHET